MTSFAIKGREPIVLDLKLIFFVICGKEEQALRRVKLKIAIHMNNWRCTCVDNRYYTNSKSQF